MRIGIVAREYPPVTASGGIGTQAYAKAHGLIARGHDVRVVTAGADDRRHELEEDGVRVVRLPGVAPGLEVQTEIADWLTWSGRVAEELAQAHAREPFDLLDFPEWGGEGFVHLLNRTEWNHVPAVVQLHGPLCMFAETVRWPDRLSELYRIGTVMESTCLRLADAVYSSSACSTSFAARYYGLDPAAVPTLHTGVDTQRFRPRLKERRPGLTIAFAGRVGEDKGVYRLLQAAAAVAAQVPGIRVHLYGNVEDPARLRAAAGALPEGSVDVAGFVDADTLAAELAKADVFAAPSTFEPGPGLVNLEAMACGLPVVACAGAGAAEVVTDGETGLLVPPRDPHALADALLRLARDGELRSRLAAEARRRTVERFDSERCLDTLASFYAGVLARTAVPA